MLLYQYPPEVGSKLLLKHIYRVQDSLSEDTLKKRIYLLPFRMNLNILCSFPKIWQAEYFLAPHLAESTLGYRYHKIHKAFSKFYRRQFLNIMSD